MFAKTPEDVKQDDVQAELSQHVGNFCELTISPSDLGLQKGLVTKNQYHEVLKEPVRSFLKANKLNDENIRCYYTLHGNTEHPHAHLFFYEKNPCLKKRVSQKSQLITYLKVFMSKSCIQLIYRK
ncbi:hypothetical protein [Ureaplasma zalophigenitalium]|uniref:Uncharacterized protein n=1 Tax=Ureaplasma zalophigenitalium TaxID=907723 RepID=A0ABT3BQ03_9BACT|nr:hypothetical protein [Ureaplasma zalophigenitalium]MCV3754053.1 hypothetical protein [Ureaplasma zalophigenitalium]